MRAYRAVARVAWSTVLVYRGNFLLQLVGVAVQTVALLAVWRVVLVDGEGNPSGFTWEEMKAYLLVAFATGTVLSGFTDSLLADRVLSGAVALDLVKPVDYQLARFAEALGYLLAEILSVAVMGAVLVLAFGGIPVPSGVPAVLFMVSLLAVVPLKFGLVYLTGLASFWTENYQGVSLTRVAVTNILSGALVPIALYPEALRWLCQVSPFAGIVSTPALLYLGRVDGAAAVRLILWQLFWALVLWAGARMVFRAALRRLVVHGG
ncbi:ABC transporter permease [Micromonospora sp. NPDC000316]|uniref:ABC transporter permease n=1 Tax=Micromonospora sp. NPDC000316 TaxID=3364216 RepID=UPI00367DE94E